MEYFFGVFFRSTFSPFTISVWNFVLHCLSHCDPPLACFSLFSSQHAGMWRDHFFSEIPLHVVVHRISASNAKPSELSQAAWSCIGPLPKWFCQDTYIHAKATDSKRCFCDGGSVSGMMQKDCQCVPMCPSATNNTPNINASLFFRNALFGACCTMFFKVVFWAKPFFR